MNSIDIPKETGTHADVLAAAGAAGLLNVLNPRLADCGDRFRVELSRDARLEDLDGGPGFMYLLVKKGSEEASSGDEADEPKKSRKRTAIPELTPSAVFDYKLQDEKYKRQRDAKKTKDRDVAEAIAEDAPDPEYRSYKIVKALQGESGPNRLVEEWAEHTPDQWRQIVWAGLSGEDDFPCKAPLVQLFNPQAAKGYALLKPTGTDRNDKTKDKWAKPFNEWLRYRGFFASCSGCLGSKGENVRLYCPIPRNISFDLYRHVVSTFRGESYLGSTAPKMDCLGTLALTRILIQKSGDANPRRSISGLYATQYQSMGQAKAVTAIDQVFVPGWFGETGAGTDLWLETLREHETALRRLDDSISEELMLLKQYRRFLQQWDVDALREFVVFLAAYGQHIFRQRGQGKWLLPQLTLSRVEAILVPYRDILENPGFRAVANALRSATVSAQVAKSKGSDYREIQYGALPELRRKLVLSRDDFMHAISEFIAGFNAESARRNEMKKSGFRVSQDEFTEFVALVDKMESPALVGSMLCAMATCKLGKDEKDEVVQ